MTTAAYTCSRCGGSGRFSFNLVHGTKCYGCSGTGRAMKKPRAPTPNWAVFGQHRATGEWLRLYNVKAPTKAKALERAIECYSRASDIWRSDYELNPATARTVKWADMADQQATTWAAATTNKEEA